MSSTTTFDLEIYQGETYTAVVEEYQPDPDSPDPENPNQIPLPNTEYSAKMQIRHAAESEEFIIELTDGSGLTRGGADGKTTIVIGANQTKLLTEDAAYDLRLTNDGNAEDVRYPISGVVKLKRRVTR